MNVSTDKKNIHNSSNPSHVRTLSLLVPKIQCKLSRRTHSVTVIGDNQETINPDCRRVTIQEYLTLVSGYS